MGQMCSSFPGIVAVYECCFSMMMNINPFTLKSLDDKLYSHSIDKLPELLSSEWMRQLKELIRQIYHEDYYTLSICSRLFSYFSGSQNVVLSLHCTVQ